VKAWQTGDTADGVIATAGAAGSVITTGASVLGPSGLAVIGESAATSWTGIGLVVTAGVSIATIGKGLIDNYHETHKFNGEESQRFLRDLDYSPEAAKILAKQDVNDGRTSAQAFGATADLLVEQKVIKDKAEFKDIVNKLAATEEGRKTLEDLVFQAGGIHTNKEGDIPRTDEKADREMQESKGVGEMIISEGGAVYVPQFPRSAKGLALLLGFDGVVSIPPGFYDAVKPA
jgi:hypothetical protein